MPCPAKGVSAPRTFAAVYWLVIVTMLTSQCAHQVVSQGRALGSCDAKSVLAGILALWEMSPQLFRIASRGDVSRGV